MKCPYCGKILPNSAKYCGGCGNDLTTKESFIDRFKSASTIRKAIVIACIIVILLIAAGAANEFFGGDTLTLPKASDQSVFDQINPSTIFSNDDGEETYVSSISEVEDANPENESSTVSIGDANAHEMNVSRNSISIHTD